MPAEVGFLKVQRSEWTNLLLSDMPAMHLMMVIGLRARWSDAENPHELGRGQALIGDFANIGMTEKQYRCAKQRLARMGLVEFTSDNTGTIATVLNGRVFSLSEGRANGQAQGGQQGGRNGGHEGGQHSEVNGHNGAGVGADRTAVDGRAEGGRRATNEEGEQEKKEKRDKNPTLAPAGAVASEVGPGLFDEGSDEQVSSTPALRLRNVLFDALCVACGEGDPTRLTKPAATPIGVALAHIKRVSPEVTVEEIQRRADNYRTHFSVDATLTASALAKHWARCEKQGKPRRRSLGRCSSYADDRPGEFDGAF